MRQRLWQLVACAPPTKNQRVVKTSLSDAHTYDVNMEKLFVVDHGSSLCGGAAPSRRLTDSHNGAFNALYHHSIAFYEQLGIILSSCSVRIARNDIIITKWSFTFVCVVADKTTRATYTHIYYYV